MLILVGFTKPGRTRSYDVFFCKHLLTDVLTSRLNDDADDIDMKNLRRIAPHAWTVIMRWSVCVSI